MTKITSANGINFISDKVSRVTIGFINRGRMVEIAVSFCAPADKFKRKTGRAIVSHNICIDRTIFLPIGHKTHEQIINDLLLSFGCFK